MKSLFLLSFIIFYQDESEAQSLEIMPGTERVFVDAQWLKPFDQEARWSLFSRTRATVDYDENTDLFSGAYFNYTTKSGFGGTVLGRISSTDVGVDVGPHFFMLKKSFMIFALVSVVLQSPLTYSWFSITRYTPSINDQWKLYTSLELFSYFSRSNHIASIQRIRSGLDYKGFQFGLAINLLGLSCEYSFTDTNPGIFLRKQF